VGQRGTVNATDRSSFRQEAEFVKFVSDGNLIRFFSKGADAERSIPPTTCRCQLRGHSYMRHSEPSASSLAQSRCRAVLGRCRG